MFDRNHYINIISLILTAAVNSLVLNLVFSRGSVLLPVLYFIIFSVVVILPGNKLFPENSSIIRVFMLLLSPVTYYLLLLEYGFLLNSVLIVFMILFISRYTDFGRMDARFFISALLIAVTLYMNFSLLLLYILFILFFYRASIPKIILFTLSAAVVFFTLHYTGVLAGEGGGRNVLSSTLGYLPLWLQVILLLVTLYAGWIIADMQEFFFIGGIITLTPALIIIFTSQGNLENNAYAAMLSMSYISFSLILLVLSVKPYKVDRYLGKVLA
jgi:hypothetical protein